METMIRKESAPGRIAELRQSLNMIYGSYVAQNTAR
jgi:hypothetical protein